MRMDHHRKAPPLLPIGPVLLALGLLFASGGAIASEIPLDERGLPLWEVREFTDFPVRLELDDHGAVLELLNREWYEDKRTSEILEKPLTRIVAHYLLNEKRGMGARDPVTHFHISNGARLDRINWLGNLSPKGMRESAGIMVNYLYDRASIDEYHEAYASEGKIHLSRQVKDRLKKAGLAVKDNT